MEDFCAWSGLVVWVNLTRAADPQLGWDLSSWRLLITEREVILVNLFTLFYLKNVENKMSNMKQIELGNTVQPLLVVVGLSSIYNLD